MRNHLLSVAFGFVLGGLVLAPLALQWQSSSGSTGPGGGAPLSNTTTPAPRHATDPDTTSQVAVTPRRFPVQLDPISSPGPGGIAQTARLPKRLPADTQTIHQQTAWRGAFAMRSTGSAIEANGWTATEGVSDARGFVDMHRQTDQPIHYPKLPSTYTLRDDLRVRNGMVASSLLAALPMKETTDITEFPIFTRLDDEPAVTLPESIVPASVRAIIELDTPQNLTNPATLNPVPLTSRGSMTVGSASSASPIISATSTADPVIAYGPAIPQGPQVPTASGSSNSSAGAPTSTTTPSGADNTPVIPATTPNTSNPTPNQPAPAPAAPTTPGPMSPAPTPTNPAPTIPAPAPMVPDPIVPTPSAPTPSIPTPNVPTPAAPLPNVPMPTAPSPAAPMLPQLPGDLPDRLTAEPIPEGVELMFGGTFYGGSGDGTFGSNDSGTGSNADWDNLIPELYPSGYSGLAVGLSATVFAVPEPMSGVLLMVGVVLLRRRRPNSRAQ